MLYNGNGSRNGSNAALPLTEQDLILSIAQDSRQPDSYLNGFTATFAAARPYLKNPAAVLTEILLTPDSQRNYKRIERGLERIAETGDFQRTTGQMKILLGLTTKEKGEDTLDYCLPGSYGSKQ